VNISDGERQRRERQRLQSLAESQPVHPLAYTVPELCRLLGIGRSMLYNEHKAGRIRLKKCGKRTIGTHEDAVAYLESLPEA